MSFRSETRGLPRWRPDRRVVMSEQGTPADAPQEAVEAPQGDVQEGQGGSPDILSQMSERLDSMPSQISEAVAAALAQQQEQGYEDDGYDDPYAQQYDQYGQPVQQDPYGGLDPNDPRDAAILQMQAQQRQ